MKGRRPGRREGPGSMEWRKPGSCKNPRSWSYNSLPAVYVMMWWWAANIHIPILSGEREWRLRLWLYPYQRLLAVKQGNTRKGYVRSIIII